MTAKKNPPFRYDIVGSFLRPAALKKQRAAAARGGPAVDAEAVLVRLRLSAVVKLIAYVEPVEEQRGEPP